MNGGALSAIKLISNGSGWGSSRSRDSARELWLRLPVRYRQQATFSAGNWETYQGVIPPTQHQVCPKGSGQTNTIERFNCTLRQHLSRLARKSLLLTRKLYDNPEQHYFLSTTTYLT